MKELEPRILAMYLTRAEHEILYGDPWCPGRWPNAEYQFTPITVREEPAPVQDMSDHDLQIIVREFLRKHPHAGASFAFCQGYNLTAAVLQEANAKLEAANREIERLRTAILEFSAVFWLDPQNAANDVRELESKLKHP